MSGCIPHTPDMNLEVIIQENGIIRLKSNGYFIARLDDELMITRQREIVVEKTGKVVHKEDSE